MFSSTWHIVEHLVNDDFVSQLTDLSEWIQFVLRHSNEMVDGKDYALLHK